MGEYGQEALQEVVAGSVCPAAAPDRSLVCNSSAGGSTDVQQNELHGMGAEWGDGWGALCQRMMLRLSLEGRERGKKNITEAVVPRMMATSGKAARTIGRVPWPSSIQATHAPIVYKKVWHERTPEGLVFEKDHRCQPYHAVVLPGFRRSGRIRISCRGHGTQVG